MRKLLLDQLDIPWGLAAQHVFPAVTADHVFWEASPNVATVRQTDRGWRADLPEDETPPVPETTIAWLLWHLEWWWADAVSGVAGEPPRSPTDVGWSGSAAASITELHRFHDAWVEILSEHDLGATCAGPCPSPQPLSVIAAWVNVELMKNIAEIGMVQRAYENRSH